mmetsp:Transcript_33264/g.40241  ORF Transcript_33264/g.40241 Transcript_33264/m.40241 type:complete len:101 (-) Transcript_33264:709-1011(-)
MSPRTFKDYVECDQHEKAYQKQGAVFVARKRVIGQSKRTKAKAMRFTRDVGLGFKTPDTAITSPYVDKKMPFHWKCLNPWSYFERYCSIYQDEAYNYSSP